MTGAEGGTHYQDEYPQKFRQELLKDVPPQAKSLLHLPLALIFHFFPRGSFCLPPCRTNSYQLRGSFWVIVGAGCRLPLGAVGPNRPPGALSSLRLFPFVTTRGLLCIGNMGCTFSHWHPDLTVAGTICIDFSFLYNFPSFNYAYFWDSLHK